MQDRTSANSMKVLLQRTAGPYMWVNRVDSAMSALRPLYPLIAAIEQTFWDFALCQFQTSIRFHTVNSGNRLWI